MPNIQSIGDFRHPNCGGLTPTCVLAFATICLWHPLERPKKKPGTRPGEVQQGGEDDERFGIIAFERSNRVRFLTNQEKID